MSPSFVDQHGYQLVMTALPTTCNRLTTSKHKSQDGRLASAQVPSIREELSHSGLELPGCGAHTVGGGEVA